MDSVYFGSFVVLLDVFFHHYRSQVLVCNNVGLHLWYDQVAEVNNDDKLLLYHYENVGRMGGSDFKLGLIITHLRIWILTGSILNKLPDLGRDKVREDLF